MSRLFVLLVAAFALLAPETASAKLRCHWSRWSVAPGSSGLVYVMVRSDTPCRLTRDFQAGAIHSTAIEIASRPANGSVTLSSGYLITYRSRPGYYGKDSFFFFIKGRRMNEPYTSTVRVELDVRDQL